MVLIACEESQVICKEFRKHGIQAYSCDLLPCSGGHPEWHIQCDVLEVLNDGWKLMIAHPPCDHICVSGAAWFKEKIADGRQQRACTFFLQIANAKIPLKCIENPVGIMSTLYRKPDQIIQPYCFGHNISKTTCLWLTGLPKLIPTEYVEPVIKNGKKRWGNQTPGGQNKTGPSPDRGRLRSVTHQGIAEAMVDQWKQFLSADSLNEV